MSSADRMTVPMRNSTEPVYWQTQDGAITADVQCGPGHVAVRVTSRGPEVAVGGEWRPLHSAGATRWLALRLLEAAVIWEREVNTDRTEQGGANVRS